MTDFLHDASVFITGIAVLAATVWFLARRLFLIKRVFTGRRRR